MPDEVNEDEATTGRARKRVRPQVKAAAMAVFVLLWVIAAVAGLELYLRLQEKAAYEKYAVYAERELAWFGVAADSDQSYWRDDEQWTVYKPNLDVERKVGERIFQFAQCFGRQFFAAHQP